MLVLLSLQCLADEVPANRDASEPRGFLATRTAYAVLTDDEVMLQEDLAMRTRPNWLERVIAAVFIAPISGLELATWPVVMLFAAVEDAGHAPSHPDYIPGTRGVSQ